MEKYLREFNVAINTKVGEMRGYLSHYYSCSIIVLTVGFLGETNYLIDKG